MEIRAFDRRDIASIVDLWNGGVEKGEKLDRPLSAT